MNRPDLVSVPPDILLGDHGGEDVRRWVRAINEWTMWMSAAGSAEATIKTRRYQLGRLAEAHLRRNPWRVSTADLAGWLGSHDWDRSTLSAYRSAMRSFYGWAVTAGKCRRNPALDLPRVRVPDHQPRPAPEAVLEAALAAADDRDRLILILAAYAGLRRAEIASLRWEHITADEKLRIVGKGGHVRRVPIRPELAAEMAAESVRRLLGAPGTGYRYSAGLDDDGGWVFPGRLDQHLRPEVVGRVATAALGGGWTAHTLRHRFASRILDGTGDLAAVQDLLGHASPATTRVYAGTSERALRAAIDAL